MDDRDRLSNNSLTYHGNMCIRKYFSKYVCKLNLNRILQMKWTLNKEVYFNFKESFP